MHQTFYIDIDEEISSIVDRLNKSMSEENYFVVPRRALFFQSIVNLKILKREAEKFGKKVVLVSQDEIGQAMAERAGMECQINAEDVEEKIIPNQDYTALDEQEDYDQEANDDYAEEEENELARAQIISRQDKQARLNSIGSGDFYNAQKQKEPAAAQPSKSQRGSREIQKKPVTPVASQRQARPQQIVLGKKPSIAKTMPNYQQLNSAAKVIPIKNSLQGLDKHKEKTLEKMFASDYRGSQTTKSQTKTQSQVQVPEKQIASGKLKNFFLGFMFLILLILAGAAAYIFIPNAKITITSNISTQKINTDIVATTVAAQAGQAAIPLRAIKQDQQVSFTYQVQGTSVVAGKKAHGTVTISNSFSSDPQTLIATTRLQTAEGKIFRINKNVVVPGYTTVSGQTKPGTAQADITADQAGSDYNISSGTTFTVPGFAASPKFDKFSATANGDFNGGATDGQVASSGALVAQGDLDKAKLQAETNFKNQMNDAIKGQLASGEMLLPEALKITITKSTTSAKVGTAASSFEWVVVGNVTAFVFNQSDVKNILLASNGISQDKNFKNDVTKIDYGSADVDFDNVTMKLKVYGEITATPTIDTEQVKKDLLGKRDDQLSDVLRKYTSIKNANVEFSPNFITRIPIYPSRVTIQVQN